MATWHPPVPAGLVTSPAVQELKYKTAVLLLLYCYDDVRRDGRVTINLKEAAHAIQEPYETVRRWWRELRSGPFFCEQIDRGRLGWVVRFADEWIDWHILSNNFQRSQVNAEHEDEGSLITFERSPVTVKQQSIGLSTTFERSPVTVDHNVYGTQDSDQAGDQREREDRDRTARSLSLDHPAVAVYRAAFPDIQINEQQGASIIDLVGDVVERLECWRATVQDYTLSPHWKPENIGNMRNRFERLLREKQQNGTRNGHSNGTTKPIRPNTNGHSERKPQVEADPERGF